MVAFAILFVCTGNICRSPMAELIFRARVDGSLPIVVSSAGTNGLSGHAMDNASERALESLGYEVVGHSARRLTPEMVAAASLVLTGDVSHRSVVLQADPLAFRRTFTLREFGRLGSGFGPLGGPINAHALESRTLEIAERRGKVDLAPPGADDIGDPFGAPLRAVRECAEHIESTISGVISALGLSSLPTEARVHGKIGA